MPICTRHLPALAVLLAIVAVPVTLFSATDRLWDECRAPDALLDAARIPGTPEGRPMTSLYQDDIFGWTRGEIDPGVRGLSKLEFQIVRGIDAQLMIREPTQFQSIPMDPEARRMVRVSVGAQELPIFVATSSSGQWVRVAAYAAIYDGGPVESLFARQLSRAVPQVIHGPRPLTLFLASGIARRDLAGEFERIAVDWIGSAWSHYDRVCSDDAGGS